MLTSLQQFLRVTAARGRTVTQVGPFLVTVDESTDHPFLNYAIPDDGAEPGPDGVAALVAAFTERARLPRLEYLEPTAPAVRGALEAAGFSLEGRLRAMTAVRAAEPGAPPGVTLLVPTSDAELAEMLSVQSVAFGGPAEIGADELARSRSYQEAGGLVLAARDDATERIVGGGVAAPTEGSGFTDVGGIAVAEAFRRRGIASALTAELTRRALAGDAHTAFLTPGDDGAARAYERAGFTTIGAMLHLRLE